MFGFFREVFSVVSKRGWWLVVLNWLFFGFVVVGSLLSGLVSFDQGYLFPASEVSPFEQSSPPLLFGFIFVFNLVLSGFGFITLTGLVFFMLSPILLGFRALLWGLLLSSLPTSKFLAALPTVILEGEGYVFAGLAGLLLGLSWLRPDWVYRGGALSRTTALRRALKDSLRVYVLAALFLAVGAIVETLTILLAM